MIFKLFKADKAGFVISPPKMVLGPMRKMFPRQVD